MHQILFILGYVIKPQRRNILQRRAKTNDASGIGCTGFKPPWCFGPGSAFTQADGGDHRTAPFPRRHLLQQGFFDIKNANSGRAIQFMPGEHVKIAIQRLNIHRMMHHRLSAIHQHFCAMLMRKCDHLRQRIFCPKHVGDMSNCQQTSFLIKQRRQRLQLQSTVGVERDHTQLCANACTKHLPGDNVSVVLHLTDDDVIARSHIAVAPAIGDQIDPFRRAADEHQLFRRTGINKQRCPLAHVLHFLGRLGA